MIVVPVKGLRGIKMPEKKQINVEVGSRIKHARMHAGLTQEEFAEKIGLSQKNISMVECGVSGISLTSLKKICSSLDISSDYLLFGSSQSSDIELLAHRLSVLPPSEYSLISDIIHRLMEYAENVSHKNGI